MPQLPDRAFFLFCFLFEYGAKKQNTHTPDGRHYIVGSVTDANLRFSFHLPIFFLEFHVTAMMGDYCTFSVLQKSRTFFCFSLNFILCVIIDQMFITKCDVYQIKLPSALGFIFL